MPAVSQRNTSQSEPASAADHEKGRRLGPVCERVPNGRLAARCIQKHGFALYQLVNQQIVDIFAIIRAVMERKRSPFGPQHENEPFWLLTGRNTHLTSLKTPKILCFGAFVCSGRADVSVATIYAVNSSIASAPQKQCKLRHFRDSEKTAAMRASNRRPQTPNQRKIPIFSRIRGLFAPLPGDNPDRGNGSAWIFSEEFSVWRISAPV